MMAVFILYCMVSMALAVLPTCLAASQIGFGSSPAVMQHLCW